MSAIEKQVQIALTASLAASRLSPYAYMLARQLGLFYWLASKTRRFGSVGQEIIMAGEFLHREFWHTYEIPIEFESASVLQVWIVETAVLGKEFPYQGQRVVPDYERPNLYIAQQSGMQRRVILEIDADETAILHAILRRKSAYHFRTIASMTDDKELQEQVRLIYGNITQRLETRNMPYTVGEDPDRDTIYLPLPTAESEEYTEKLSWVLERSGLIEVTADAIVPKRYHEPQWRPKQVGDVARRLRELDMINESEIGSIRGVYDKSDPDWEDDFASRWEKMDILERAAYEQRVVGCGTIQMNGESTHIIAIMRDRLNDAIGQQFLLRQKKKQLLVTIDLHGENESIKYFREDMMTYFNSANPISLSENNLEEACETWEDGLRVAPMLNVLFKVVEMQQSFVSPKSIYRTLQVWLGKETGEEAV